MGDAQAGLLLLFQKIKTGENGRENFPFHHHRITIHRHSCCIIFFALYKTYMHFFLLSLSLSLKKPPPSAAILIFCPKKKSNATTSSIALFLIEKSLSCLLSLIHIFSRSVWNTTRTKIHTWNVECILSIYFFRRTRVQCMHADVHVLCKMCVEGIWQSSPEWKSIWL